MTRDDIIRMAREAGLCTWTVPPDERAAEWADFAALVAAADRREYAIRIKQDIADFLAKPPAPEVRAPLSDKQVDELASPYLLRMFGFIKIFPEVMRGFARAIERAYGITAKEPT